MSQRTPIRTILMTMVPTYSSRPTRHSPPLNVLRGGREVGRRDMVYANTEHGVRRTETGVRTLPKASHYGGGRGNVFPKAPDVEVN